MEEESLWRNDNHKGDVNGNSRIGKCSIYKLKTALDEIKSMLGSLAERISRTIGW